MHDLHAEAFVDREELRTGAIDLFLSGRSRHRPVEIRAGDEVRQADDRNPAEGRFVTVIDSVNAFLPPESLQRRHDIVEKAFNTMVCLVTHLQRIGNGIQDADGLLISAAFIVGIALAAHGNEIRFRNRHDNRFFWREIELLVFLLEIKGHLSEFLLCIQR